MLKENLKNLRKSKGLSQEELAIKLNVVRQTISKWEKGLSVPDSEMLIKIAAELDTSVSVLLGETLPHADTPEIDAISAKLELLNEQLARQKETRRKIWRIVFIVIGILAAVTLLEEILSALNYNSVMNTIEEDAAIIGGSDAPTHIFLSSVSFNALSTIAAISAAVVSVIGIFKTTRR